MSGTEASVILSVVENIDRLPPMPAHIIELRRRTADPDVTFVQILPLIERDPNLCADLLRITNSAQMGLTRQVDTIQQAILFLGMSHFVEYLATQYIARVMNQTFPALSGVDQLHQHATGIATVVRRLAHLAGWPHEAQESLVISGLLHDMGRFVLTLAAHPDASAILYPPGMTPFSQEPSYEHGLFGIDHAEIGARLCTKWNFPDRIVQTIKRHHKPFSENGFQKESAIIFLAHILTVPGISAKVIATAFPDACFQELRLSPEQLAAQRDQLTSA